MIETKNITIIKKLNAVYRYSNLLNAKKLLKNKNFSNNANFLIPEQNKIDFDNRKKHIFDLLGNTTTFSAKIDNQKVTLNKNVFKDLEQQKKFEFKSLSNNRKKTVKIYKHRVSYCGQRPIFKDMQTVQIVKGEKGGIFFRNMMRCGLVWFCPDCNYKISKVRANDLYEQLKKDRKNNNDVLFVTVTIQHKINEKLNDNILLLNKAVNFANTHRSFKELDKDNLKGYYRALEVTYSEKNGFHPHLHFIFTGKNILDKIKKFKELIEYFYLENNKNIYENTVLIDKWNGSIDEMKEYMFKGMLEKEICAGGNKTGKAGKTFWQMLDEPEKYHFQISEYVSTMRGKKQNFRSKYFFDKKVKTDKEILKDNKVLSVIAEIPMKIFKIMIEKKLTYDFLSFVKYINIAYSVEFLRMNKIDISYIQVY